MKNYGYESSRYLYLWENGIKKKIEQKKMKNEFDYYIIEPMITERTPLLMNNGAIDPDGIDFLYYDTRVADDYVAHLQFLMSNKNPNLEVDYLFLETYAVFSEKVYNALKQHMPINNLQLVKSVINENDEEYKGFWIANIYQTIQSFDESLSIYKKINRRGEWVGIKKIVLDKERLSQIPLDERLVFLAKEDPGLKLYHESIIEILKSVNPKGMRSVPVEEWTDTMIF